MLNLYLIRHGETIWNLEAKTQGCKNIRLSEKGILQGKLLAEKLRNLNEDFKNIISSDLDRCYLTAKLIAEELKIDVEINSDLREMSFGDWEGLTLDEIQKFYSKEYTSWRNEPHIFCIPKGDNLKTVQNRCLEAVNKIIMRNNEGSIIIVSHSVAIKTIILGLVGIELKYFYNLTLGNASINKLEFREYGAVLTKLNDTCHLEENYHK